jgi:phage replication O-like protein O
MTRGNREHFIADWEDGYTKVPNLLQEALAIARLNAAQKSICFFIIRRTYGWNCTEDAISLSDFAEACGTTRGYISKQLNQLLKKNIVRRLSYQPGKTSVYSIEPCLTKWSGDCIDLALLEQNHKHGIYDASKASSEQLQLSSDGATVDQQLSSNPTTVLVDNWTTPLSSNCTTVDHDSALAPPELEAVLKKELKKEKERRLYRPDSTPFQLSQLLLIKILEHLPSYKKPDLQNWSREMDLLIRQDKRPPDEVRAVILFCQNDPFWQNRIMSVTKLRKQYDVLNAKRLKPHVAPVFSPTARRYQSPNLNEEEADEYKGFYR